MVLVVEADVERGLGLGRDHVVGRIADIDRRDLQGRGLEMRRAFVELLARDRIEHAHEPVRGVVGQVRIGGVALHAADREIAGHGAAPADLDHVAELFGIGGLADDAHVGDLALLLHPAKDFVRPVDGIAFLVAGDEEADRALEGLALGAQERIGGRGEGGDGALHVGRAAAPELAVAHLAREGIERPFRLVAGRHHVGVAREAEMRLAAADAGIEVVDARIAPALAGAERQAMARKAHARERRFEHVERARVARRDARPPDHLAGEG
jgi:hypothetical protein